VWLRGSHQYRPQRLQHDCFPNRQRSYQSRRATQYRGLTSARDSLVGQSAGFYVNIHTSRIRRRDSRAIDATGRSVNHRLVQQYFLPTARQRNDWHFGGGNLADLLLGTVLINGQPAQAVPGSYHVPDQGHVPAGAARQSGVLALQDQDSAGVASKPANYPCGAQTRSTHRLSSQLNLPGSGSTVCRTEKHGCCSSAPGWPSPRISPATRCRLR
jgi:hypothetical protein